MAGTANEYNLSIGPTTASRFVRSVGIQGVTFSRPTCLLDMIQGIERSRVAGRLTEAQADRMTRNLTSQVRDLYHWMADNGRVLAPRS